MDELALVVRLRDALPDGVDLTGPERRLATEISAEVGPARGARGPQRGRASRRYGLRLAVVGMVAAAVAAAVVIAQGSPAPHSPSAGAGSHAGLVPWGTEHPRPAASAGELVAYATRAAAAAPAFDPKPHDWIFQETVQATSSGPAGGMLFGPVNGRLVMKAWNRVDGLQRAEINHGRLVISASKLYGGELGGWPNSTYAYIDSLPSSPAKLKPVIEAGLKAENYVIGSGNIGIFNSIENLMEAMVLPPKLSAGLYSVLASDPAVHFDPRVADFAGQTGVAFYTYQEGYIKSEIVINPRTYAYMGFRDVAYRANRSLENSGEPADGTIHVKKGQILGEEAVLHFGIVQHAGQIPRS